MSEAIVYEVNLFVDAAIEAEFAAWLRDHAPAMRADGIARFGSRFRAERRVLSPIKAY